MIGVVHIITRKADHGGLFARVPLLRWGWLCGADRTNLQGMVAKGEIEGFGQGPR